MQVQQKCSNYLINKLFKPFSLLLLMFLTTALLSSYFLFYYYNPLDANIKNMLKMSYWEFDQSEQGWRSLTDLKAAKTIDLYVNTIKVTQADKVNLYFHAGQAYAFSNDYQTALERFRLAKHTTKQEWTKGWNAYVDATIAFLEGDSIKLNHAKTLLEQNKSLSIKISETEVLYPNQVNLGVVERLAKGLEANKKYSEVY